MWLNIAHASVTVRYHGDRYEEAQIVARTRRHAQLPCFEKAAFHTPSLASMTVRQPMPPSDHRSPI